MSYQEYQSWISGHTLLTDLVHHLHCFIILRLFWKKKQVIDFGQTLLTEHQVLIDMYNCHTDSRVLKWHFMMPFKQVSAVIIALCNRTKTTILAVRKKANILILPCLIYFIDKLWYPATKIVPEYRATIPIQDTR